MTSSRSDALLPTFILLITLIGTKLSSNRAAQERTRVPSETEVKDDDQVLTQGFQPEQPEFMNVVSQGGRHLCLLVQRCNLISGQLPFPQDSTEVAPLCQLPDVVC